MQQTDFQERFTQLPDNLKIEALDFIEFLHFKADKHKYYESNNIDSFNKKITAKELLSLSILERNTILKKQAVQAKIMYEENPDLLLPDLTDDFIED